MDITGLAMMNLLRYLFQENSVTIVNLGVKIDLEFKKRSVMK